ncbi:hypothetical protein L6452_19524 [Arctium lappa]|uniref:Uncharacterized protein n=1 Tax=Arctium lappa TaxID=4217 RepID=A0ACB9BD81_ARCLA|nr:hypothetical protein L6452_19524 [Arctium lappa]
MKQSPSPSHIKRNPRERTKAIVIRNSPESVQIRYKEETKEIKTIRRSSTLKDCLLASPNNHHHALNPGKIQVFTTDLPPPTQIMSSSEVQTKEFCTSRITFPVEKWNEKLGKVVERDEYEERSFTPMLERSGSQKAKKKVSFRVPEESDIFVFCSEY